MSKNRYAKVNDRLEAVAREISQMDTDPESDLDHIEWLVCEREALLLEKKQLEVVMTGRGEVEY